MENTNQPTQQAQQTSVNEPKMNTMAVVGVVLSFFVPIVGLVLCIISLSQISKRVEKGKGLAITGIVVSLVFMLIQILFISIFFISLGDVRSKAHDSERKADIRLVESKLAEYYADNGSYPHTLDDMKDLPSEAKVGPNYDEYYQYNVSPLGCTTDAGNCKTYTITSRMDNEEAPYVQSSDNY